MSAPLAEGSLFAGRYRILRSIAQGGMGAVYEVLHVETNRRRALKVMHPHIFESHELRERFKREARVAADIESEHIVDVFDAGVDEATRTPFMVMELLRGEELGIRVKRVGPLPPAEVLTYLRQTALALDKTHAASIVHRDLKPDNLFLTQRDDGSPRIKIFDFGVAKVVAEGVTGQGTQSLGTPLYMAPEQFYPGAKMSPAADIFALGLVAYTLLVSIPYWRPESMGGLIPFITIAIHGPKESPIERAAALGVALPREFDAWFFRATAVKPERRFDSASAAVSALEKVFEGLPVADLVVTAPIVRSPAPSMPALTSTPGTFVPTAFPANADAVQLEPLVSDSPAPSHRRRTPFVLGAVVLGAIGTFIVAWMLVRTPEIAPVAPASSSPSIAGSVLNEHARAASTTSNAPHIEPASTPLVEPKSESTPPLGEKPKKDKTTVKPITPALPPVSAPTTKKTANDPLLGQD